jgi:hypothetical protein
MSFTVLENNFSPPRRQERQGNQNIHHGMHEINIAHPRFYPVFAELL